ncbi:MMPL family transporter [Actinomyces minihominis]|uniref:MMPL family transporter n=1 Tax=Actinomyces minihominis TaxID=2002838 RepID=UPI000C069255|nr:MMPL family transporter [Actinomyces minihominis]
MFTWLGKADTKRPVVILITWAIVVVVAGMASLWGFGQGGLFQRMASSEALIPGTDSSKVQKLISGGTEGGETSILVVSGVDTDTDWDDLAAFAEKHRELFEDEFVDTVADAFLISSELDQAEADAQAQLEQTIKDESAKAIEEALAQAEESAQQELAAAEAQMQTQVEQAAALGPEAQAAAQAQVDAARAQMQAEFQAQMDQAKAEITQQVTEQVTAAATEQFEEAQNDPEVKAQLEDAQAQMDALVSQSGDAYVVVVTFKPELSDAQVSEARAELADSTQIYRDALQIDFPGAQIEEMSGAQIEAAIMDQVQNDLVTGEALSLPVAALIMLIVFGGALFAGMPLIGAVSSIAAGMGAIWAATFFTTIDSFILNVVSIIGVALSIDYGLLVVSRYREESKLLLEGLGHSRTAKNPAALKSKVVVPAVIKTVETAGRTVLFSAVTIALSLIGLAMIPVQILQVIAWGGIAVTLLAVLAAITLVPALLALLGRKVLKPSPITKVPGVGRLVEAIGDTSTDHGFFYSIARWVQKRPWPIMITVTLVLVAMALPTQSLFLRNHFADYIPQDTPLRTAFETVQNDFPELATPSATAVIDAPEDSPAVLDFVVEVSELPNVDQAIAQPLEEDSSMTRVDVRVIAEDPAGPEVVQVVHDMRALDSEAEVWVGGSAASQIDFTDTLKQYAPLALLVVAIAVTILLFLMTGSVVVPVRALIINTLSLMAALGLTTAIFNNGWFGVPETGGLEIFVVAVLIAFGFGLAMDYEVFLLSRIKEYWDAGDDNNTAVAKGLQRSGRIISSAAAIIVAVFIGFAMGDMVAIKQMGIALAIMVVTDATITRMLLVPAVMTILGKWNWWAPKPLAKLAAKIGLKE